MAKLLTSKNYICISSKSNNTEILMDYLKIEYKSKRGMIKYLIDSEIPPKSYYYVLMYLMDKY